MKRHVYCIGVHCSVRNTCLRYTAGRVADIDDGTHDKFIRSCTNQKKYLQDEKRVK